LGILIYNPNRISEASMAHPQRQFEIKDVNLSNDLRMRYYEWPGSKPNLILLHPSTGYGRMWEWAAGYLGSRFHIYALDQRGHGDSSRPDGDYSAEEYAEDLHLFMQKLGLGKAVIAGHSLGSRVGQAFAAMYPSEAQALILVGGPHYSNFFPERHRVVQVLEGANRTLTSQTEFPSREAAMAYLKTNRPGDSKEALGQRIEHNMLPVGGKGLAFKYDKVRVAQGLAHMSDNLRKHAEKVKCPVAILRGTKSSHLSKEEAERVAKCWSNAVVLEVEGDYGLEVENPEGLARAVERFVEERVR
jgi:pimeloyl-ACP methyl ester carboxylesterase